MAYNTQVTALSSTGVSPTVGLDPVSKTTSISLTATPSVGDLVIQATLWVPGSAGTPAWFALSSTHITSSSAGDGIFLSVLTPIAGLRLSSSAWTSGTATLQSLQAVSA